MAYEVGRRLFIRFVGAALGVQEISRLRWRAEAGPAIKP